MKKILISLGSVVTLGLPLFVSAAANLSYAGDLINQAIGLTRSLLVFLIALAVVWFIWNVISYTISGDEEKKKGSKDQMVKGIIAIAVIVSIWGLVAILQGAFIGGTNGAAPGNLNSMIPTY